MATYSFTFDPSGFDGGDYTLEIIATDNSANENENTPTPINFTVVAGTAPNTGEAEQVPGAGRPDIEVDIAFGCAPLATVRPDQWIDVTGDVLMASGISIVRGASADNPTPTAGSINFTLVDTARKYDPLNTDSPYYGGLTPGCPVRVLGNYTNLPVQIVTSRSLSNPNAIVVAGTSTINLAYGYVDGFPQTYPDQADNHVLIAVNAPDALAILGRTSFLPVHPFTAIDEKVDGAAIVSSSPIISTTSLVAGSPAPDYSLADVAIVGDPDPYNPEEPSGTRIQALCEIAGISDDLLAIDAGQSNVEAGAPQENNLLDHFRTVTATENGRLYQTPAGVIRYIGRGSSLHRLNANQALFCESTGFGVPYATLDLDPADRRFLKNRVLRGSQTVPQVVSQDEASIAANGTHEDSETLAFSNAQDAVNQADYLISRYSGAPARITGLTIKPDRSPDVMFPVVVQLELGSRYAVARTPLGIGDPIVKYVTIEKLSHTFDKFNWVTTVDLGEADTASYFTADDDALGLVDAGNLVGY